MTALNALSANSKICIILVCIKVSVECLFLFIDIFLVLGVVRVSFCLYHELGVLYYETLHFI